MNLLIVDDTPTNLKLLRAQLEAEGHAVFEAHDGVDALALLERQRVDVVISDILMPRLDGYRLCHEIRTHVEVAAEVKSRALVQQSIVGSYIIRQLPALRCQPEHRPTTRSESSPDQYRHHHSAQRDVSVAHRVADCTGTSVSSESMRAQSASGASVFRDDSVESKQLRESIAC